MVTWGTPILGHLHFDIIKFDVFFLFRFLFGLNQQHSPVILRANF